MGHFSNYADTIFYYSYIRGITQQKKKPGLARLSFSVLLPLPVFQGFRLGTQMRIFLEGGIKVSLYPDDVFIDIEHSGCV